MRALRGALAIDSPAATEAGRHVRAASGARARPRELYAAEQALFVHAVASPYRDRSHFDGQNVLETGGAAPYQLKDGWMNRLVGLLPRARRAGDRVRADACRWRCAAPPRSRPMRRRRCRRRATTCCSACSSSTPRDAQLHALWSAAMDARGMAGAGGGERGRTRRALGRMAASFLARAEGPRIAMIETGGWDTHSAQSARLPRS